MVSKRWCAKIYETSMNLQTVEKQCSRNEMAIYEMIRDELEKTTDWRAQSEPYKSARNEKRTVTDTQPTTT